MFSRIRKVLALYPRQFWLVVLVMMLAYTFHSMLWPFLLIFSSEKLGQPLTVLAGLLTINSLVGMVTTFLGGAISDRFGRKWVMAVSLLLCAVSWYFFQFAGTIGYFIALMALNGATTPLYRLAADSMMVDLILPEDRLEAYSIMRMGNNLGVTLGPVIGGFTAAISYNLSFKITGIGILLCGLLVVFFFTETIKKRGLSVGSHPSMFGGYQQMLQNRAFLVLIGGYTLNRIASSTIWMMLGVYVKDNFGINESLYGFIPMTNAVMVILFQVITTRWVKKQNTKWMLVLGATFYGLALIGVALGNGFWMFWLCMVITTLGEMIIVPTSTTSAAAMAPEEMRGRYMSIYNLTNGIGSGAGPLIGGVLNDNIAPAATWYGGGLIGLLGAAVFLIDALTQKQKHNRIKD